MKVLSTDGLTKLIELIKGAFISVDDTVTTSITTLATVATSGSYNDLSNKPTIPDTSNLANKDLSNLSSTGNSKFQASLVSGTNIKTINNNSILGSGNLTLDGLPSQTGKAGKFLQTDGWIQFGKNSSASGQLLNIVLNRYYTGIGGSDGAFTYWSSASGQLLSALCPVSKGETFTIYYNLGGATTAFKFIYLKGSESEAN